MESTSQSAPAAEKTSERRSVRGFLAARNFLWRHLPFGLNRWIPENFIGFCMLNLCTFSVDLLILTLLYRVLGLPNPVAVTIGYGTAFTLAFLLNRWFNFRSHAPLGRATARYVLVVAINYLAFILGVGSGLVLLGVNYLVARLLAGACEGLWMYCTMRWFVFREPPAARELRRRSPGGALRLADAEQH